MERLKRIMNRPEEITHERLSTVVRAPLRMRVYRLRSFGQSGAGVFETRHRHGNPP